MPRRAAFLDRDGTVIRDRVFLEREEDIAFFPDTVDALRRLSAAGYALVIITNQSGIARGYFDAATVERLNAAITARLAAQGVTFAGVYYCPHHADDGCLCRKPGTALLEQAARDLDLDLANSVMIGDRVSDAEAGENAGCRLGLLMHSETGWDADTPRERFASLSAAVERVLSV